MSSFTECPSPDCSENPTLFSVDCNGKREIASKLKKLRGDKSQNKFIYYKYNKLEFPFSKLID